MRHAAGLGGRKVLFIAVLLGPLAAALLIVAMHEWGARGKAAKPDSAANMNPTIHTAPSKGGVARRRRIELQAQAGTAVDSLPMPYATLDWLLTQQHVDGSWRPTDGLEGLGSDIAATSLIAMTMIRMVDLTAEEKYARSVRRGYQWVRSIERSDGSFCALQLVNALATGLMLEAVNEPGGLQAHFRNILNERERCISAAKAVCFGIDSQCRDGSWPARDGGNEGDFVTSINWQMVLSRSMVSSSHVKETDAEGCQPADARTWTVPYKTFRKSVDWFEARARASGLVDAKICRPRLGEAILLELGMLRHKEREENPQLVAHVQEYLVDPQLEWALPGSLELARIARALPTINRKRDLVVRLLAPLCKQAFTRIGKNGEWLPDPRLRKEARLWGTIGQAALGLWLVGECRWWLHWVQTYPGPKDEGVEE